MIKWVETKKDVYFAIYINHKDELGVFGSYSDPDGSLGAPTMETEWGFKWADRPIIKCISTGDGDNQWSFKYYIASLIED